MKKNPTMAVDGMNTGSSIEKVNNIGANDEVSEPRFCEAKPVCLPLLLLTFSPTNTIFENIFSFIVQCLSASIGFNCDACRDGNNPDIAPTIIENNIAPITTGHSISITSNPKPA